MLRANVDRPEQGCEKQWGFIAVDLWRIGTGAYERYFETSCLNLHFLVHRLECVMKNTLCDRARFLRQTDGQVDVPGSLKGRKVAALVVRRFQASERNCRR
jgi:hypothetical protein